MARLMSVAFTEQAVRNRAKTVTRRKGWRCARPGHRLCLCRKVMGRKPGEPLVRLAEVEIVSVRREVLKTITPDEVAREGFPGMHPLDFVHEFFVEAQRMEPDEGCACCWLVRCGLAVFASVRACSGRSSTPCGRIG